MKLQRLGSLRFIGLGSLLLSIVSPLSSAPVYHWVDTGAAFRAGTLGNSGHNLYVNPRGELETIRHFDVDGDGNLDLVTNSGHDYVYDLPAALVAITGGRDVRSTPLDVQSAARVLSADFNRDGFTDLLFVPGRQNVSYQTRGNLIVAWGDSDGWSNTRLTRQLPIYGGFSAESHLIPDVRAAIGDLNQDGWPDIVTLNSKRWMSDQPDGRIVRIYWGGPQGFILTKYADAGVPDAIELAVGKFDNPTADTVVVLTSTGAIQYLAYDSEKAALIVGRKFQLPEAPDWGAKAEKNGKEEKFEYQCWLREPGSAGAPDSLWIGTNTDALIRVGGASASSSASGVEFIRARPASQLTLGRLDADEFPDLVVTDFKAQYHAGKAPVDSRGTVTVLWGAAGGFNADRIATLSIPHAIRTAVDDLNADGNGDLLVSVYRGENTMQADSLIYLGNGTRDLPAKPLPVATCGAQDVLVAKLNAATRATAIFANSFQYTLDALIPTRLFWGSPTGFSGERMVELPNLAGQKASLSDLNADGFNDLILVRGGDVSIETLKRATDIGANIYWGGPKGMIGNAGPNHIDASRRQVLPAMHLCAINVADLNQDGYLDVVLGAYEDAETNSPGDYQTDLSIYYGSEKGLTPETCKKMRIPGRSESCLIADLDRDGWLDIAVGHLSSNLVSIYRGGPDGFAADRKVSMPYVTPCGLNAADLNGDGWLDLIVGTYSDMVAYRRDTGMSIFWGGPSGYRQSNSQWLPGLSPDSLKVADLDADGSLDIIVPNYHGEFNRQDMPSYIYWGSTKGFSLSNRTSLAVNSGCDVMVADVNNDGKLDLAFSAHSVNSGHRVDSPVYLNDGNRFKAPKVQYIPVLGPFYSWVQDIGNIYDRRYVENFESRTFTWKDSCTKGRLTVEASTPEGARVGAQVRSASDESQLAHAAWREVAAGSFPLAPGDRVLQYRLDLVSKNGDSYPRVHKVEVGLR